MTSITPPADHSDQLDTVDVRPSGGLSARARALRVYAEDLGDGPLSPLATAVARRAAELELEVFLRNLQGDGAYVAA